MTKRLAVFETNTGRLEAIDPGQASAIPIPTAQIKAVRPAAGTVAGEMVYETSTKLALIWDGSAWDPVQSDFLHLLPDDATALAGGIPVGHVAISQATGNFFVHRAQGVVQWGIREFATQAALLADTTTADGQIAMALDTGALYIRNGGTWHGSPIAHFATEVALLAATPADGTLAWGDDTGLVYARSGGNWVRVNSPTISVGAHPATPAAGDLNYRAGRGLQVYDGTDWKDTASRITVATALPSNPNVGDVFWFEPGHRAQIYTSAGWESMGVGYFAGASAPQNPIDGLKWYNTTTKTLCIWANSSWVPVGTLDSVTQSAPDKNWANQNVIPVAGEVAVYRGNAVMQSGSDTLVIATNSNGDKLVEADFLDKYTGVSNYDGNSLARSNSIGAGVGGGWWKLSYNALKTGSWADFEVCLNSLRANYWTLHCKCSYLASNGQFQHSELFLRWNQQSKPLTSFYLSQIQGSDPNYTLRRIS